MQKRPKKNSNPEVMELFLKDLKARYEEGVRRYGVPLQPFNERDALQDAYEEAISETSKNHAPWFVIPADKKWFARVAAIQIIINALEEMDLKFPELSAEDKAGLAEAKRQLESE